MLTSQIIAHELEHIGSIRFNDFDQSKKFLDTRLAHCTTFRDDILYLTDDPLFAKDNAPSNITFMFVSSEQKDIPEGFRCVLFTEKTVEFVSSVISDIFLKYREWEAAMDAILIEGQDLQQLLDVSSKMLINNVVVVDPALKLLAYTKDVPCDDPITMELIKHGYHTDENIKQFKLQKRFDPWANQHGFIINDTYKICKYITVVKSFKTKSSFSLIVIMMCNIITPNDYLLDIFEMFLSRVRRFAENEYPEDKPSGNTVDTFLRDLIEKRIIRKQFIQERSRFVGIPYEGSFCLFYIDVGEHPNFSTARLLSEIAQKVAPAKTLFHENAILVLCFNCKQATCTRKCLADTCPSRQPTITHRLNKTLEEYDVYCGRSSSFTDLTEVHRAYLQAKEILGLGIQNKDKPSVTNSTIPKKQHARVLCFDSYFIEYMIEKAIVAGEDLVKATHGYRLLQSIIDYDKEHKTDNYSFLYQYLRYERRSSSVANLLHMHRNNIKYRIDRIEKTFGLDTDDPDVRLELILAYLFFDGR